MRVVLDTGIFMSAFVNKEGHPRQALNFWLERTRTLNVSPTSQPFHQHNQIIVL